MSKRSWTRFWPILAALAVTGGLAGLAVVSGAYYYLTPSLPSAQTLREVELQTPLRIYTRDGRLMAQIGEKRRTPAAYDEIPEIVIQAFLAAEDDRFFEHPGFDYQGIARAAFNLLRTGDRSQGGSTITQQLARVYFLTRERSFVRKAKELILAVQIENEFSKPEILELYLNKIFLGQRAYGVGAAAEVYFGKSLANLNIAEAATIAGLPKAPSTLNPVSNKERAAERRRYVLRRMLELDFISADQHTEASAWPLESRLYGPKVELEAPYVTEMVRADLVRRFGTQAYTDGYKVITTIDSNLQRSAQLAVRSALLEYDRRHGFRGAEAQNSLDALIADTDINEATELDDNALAELVDSYPRINGLPAAVVLALAEGNSALVYIDEVGRETLSWEQLKWRPFVSDDVVGDEVKSVDKLLAVGDVVRLVFTADGWQLVQLPLAQSAFVALDARDAATVALVGGFDFSASKFNRAVQTKRQPGSSFKPFIYSAALENGFTTATLVNDAPVVFDDANLETTWRPENYSRRFNGPTRLREALVKSLNLVSVRILRNTGLGPAISHISSFGLPPSALPRDLSLALGSGGASPWELAGGYATFASGGFKLDRYIIDQVLNSENEVVFAADPVFVCAACGEILQIDKGEEVTVKTSGQYSADRPIVIDANQNYDKEIPRYKNVDEMSRDGLSWRPTINETPAFFAATENPPTRVISPENAFLIYDMMRDVIQRGTGRRARDLGRKDIAGKTGTSNDRRDAWFSGFNGDLVATAWVGFDQDRSLGAGEEGSRTALPIWKYFMEEALAGTGNAELPQPAGIIAARIVPETGLIAPAGYSGAIFELFREDQVPETQAADSSGSMSLEDPGDFSVSEDLF